MPPSVITFVTQKWAIMFNRVAQFAITAVLFCFSSGVVLATPPKLGTWLCATRQDGVDYPYTMVLCRNHGNSYDGFIDYTIKNGPLWVMLVSMEYTPSTKQVRIEHRATHTTADETGVAGGSGVDQGIANHDGTVIRDIVTPWDSDSPQSTATWKSDEIQISYRELDEMAGSLDERVMLYQQWSAGYRFRGKRVLSGSDTILRKRLSTSNDAFVREFGQISYELGVSSIALHQRERANDITFKKGIPSQIYQSVFMAIDDAGTASTDPLKSLVNSDVMQEKYRWKADSLREYIIQFESSHYYCDAMENMFASRDIVPNSNKISISYSDKEGFVYATIRNQTGHSFHNCVCRTKMVVDQQKMDSHEKDYRQNELPSAVFYQWAGVQALPAVEGDLAAIAYHRLDKCIPFFVQEWKSGETVEMRFAKSDEFKAVAKSCDLWIGCDEGQARVALSPGAIRAKIIASEKKNEIKAPFRRRR